MFKCKLTIEYKFVKIMKEDREEDVNEKNSSFISNDYYSINWMW